MIYGVLSQILIPGNDLRQKIMHLKLYEISVGYLGFKFADDGVIDVGLDFVH